MGHASSGEGNHRDGFRSGYNDVLPIGHKLDSYDCFAHRKHKRGLLFFEVNEPKIPAAGGQEQATTIRSKGGRGGWEVQQEFPSPMGLNVP